MPLIERNIYNKYWHHEFVIALINAKHMSLKNERNILNNK